MPFLHVPANSRMLLSNRERSRAPHRAAATSFHTGQYALHCEVVLTSRRPLKAERWFPYVEETGGKIFRSNG